MAKLPTFDQDWAKTQYIWGLHQRVAELVVIAEPSDLHAAIHQAEKIEMARGTISGNVQSQQSGSWTRGRGRYARGRGRFNAVQQSYGQSSQPQGASGPSFAASQPQGQKQYPPVGTINAVAAKVGDIGHMIAHRLNPVIFVVAVVEDTQEEEQ